eukprot:gene20202-22178_t
MNLFCFICFGFLGISGTAVAERWSGVSLTDDRSVVLPKDPAEKNDKFKAAKLIQYSISSSLSIEQHRRKRQVDENNTNLPMQSGSNNASATAHPSNGKSSKLSKLPVIIPAALTVLIFVACVACIAYKNYNIEEFPFVGSNLDITETSIEPCCSTTRGKRRARKPSSKHELYDDMLKHYKAETFTTRPTRRSSTINVAGAEGHDPQSIARKHLILRNMRDPRKSGGSAVEALVKMSSKALIPSSVARNDLTNGKIIEEGSKDVSKEDLPAWLQEDAAPYLSNNIEEDKDEFDEKANLLAAKEHNANKRNSGSAWFKYKRLEKQAVFDNADSDEELNYDCAQHIQRILSASRENIEEARRILPDDVKDILLPEDLEAALAEFEFWPDSSV